MAGENKEALKEFMKEFLRPSNARQIFDDSTSSSSESEEENGYKNGHRFKRFIETTVEKYSDVEFKLNFRLEKPAFDYLMAFLEPLMVQTNPERVMMPIKTKVLITLYYLGNQDSIRTIANRFNVSQKTVQTIINLVVNLLYSHSPKFIKWPTQEEANTNEQLFYDKGRIKNVLGCIGASHISYLEGENGYVNKPCSSVALQGVITYKMEFIDVYCGETAAMHCAKLLRRSGLFKKIGEDLSCTYGNFLLGDTTYVSKKWLVPPFRDNGSLTDQEHQFNIIHSALRTRVDRAFDMLKGRFQRLRRFQAVNRTFTIRATVAAIVLHNISVKHNNVTDTENYNWNQPLQFDLKPKNISVTAPSKRRQQAFSQLFPTV